MPVRVEAFEADVVGLVLILDQLHIVGEEAGFEISDGFGISHLEPKVGKPRARSRLSSCPSANAKPWASFTMITPSEYKWAVSGSKPKNRA